MVFVILGVLLLLLSLLLFLFVTGPTLHTEEFQSKGFGGRWSRRETAAFFLALGFAVTRGFGLFGLFLLGVVGLTYGVASLRHASLATIVVAEVLAFLGSTFLWWGYLQRTRRQDHIPFPITQQTVPPVLLLNTPYTFHKLTMIIHSMRRRQAFQPIVHPLAAPGQVQPVTWFLEIACTLKNHSRKEAHVWAQLQEIVPENTASPTPLCLRQFLPLSEDEATDRDLGSNVSLSMARYQMVVKGTEESKFFFKFDERMQVHTMAFVLHLSRKNQASSQKLLFTVDV